MQRLAIALSAAILLVSCTTTPRRDADPVFARAAYEARVGEYRDLHEWDLSGRLSIDDGQDGGSGRLQWRVEGDHSNLDFRGAMGRGAWQLDIKPGQAVLKEADGSITTSAGIDELIETELGWHIPVDSLQWWVLGIAAPGPAELMDLDDEGRMVALQQHGWNIEFSRYRQFSGFELPARLDAVRGQRRVKLAVASWAPADHE